MIEVNCRGCSGVRRGQRDRRATSIGPSAGRCSVIDRAYRAIGRQPSICWRASVALRSMTPYPWATAAPCALARRSRARSRSPGARRSTSILPQARFVRARKNLAPIRVLSSEDWTK